MNANKYVLTLNNTNNKEITIPLEIDWDFTGQQQSIELYEDEVTKEVIGNGYDFEVTRFPHDKDDVTQKTEINYEFFFYSGGPTNNSLSWNQSYTSEGFTVSDIYYFSNNFSKSFFKLDFYDTIDDKRQTNYITVILPTTQGFKTGATLNYSPALIKYPKFKLDYVGDKEGFFIYWLKSLDFLPINTFYMTAKFYNAKTGKFVKMMNTPQYTFSGDPTTFDALKYFYYRVVFNYVSKTYRVYEFDPLNTTTNIRVGTTTPIKWYEYVNPL